MQIIAEKKILPQPAGEVLPAGSADLSVFLTR